MSVRVIIFANGSLPAPERARALLQEGDILIGADGGTRHLLALGLSPHAVIGDFDSLSPELLRFLAE
ncbi:MAG: thiamine diphosphokinase, partial [Anaerolineales bacterium]